MAWQLKSDKTDKVYDFDDDVDQQTALQYMDHLEKPAAFKDVAAQAIPEFKRGAATLAAGIHQIGEDIGIADKGQAAAVLGEIAKERKEELPRNMSTMQEGVLGGLASMPEMAITALPGLGVLGKAATVGRATKTSLGLAGGMEGLREYGEQRAGGMEPGRAALHAGASGGAEILGEIAPTKYLFGGKMSTDGFLTAVGKYLGKEIVGEEATTLLQMANRKLSINPDLTMDDLLHNVATTAVGAAVGAGGMGTLYKGVDVAGKAIDTFTAKSIAGEQQRTLAKEFERILAESTLPPVERTQGEPDERKVGKTYEQSVEQFRQQNIDPALWSEVSQQYMPKMEIPSLDNAATREEAVETLKAFAQERPGRVGEFVAANLLQFSQHGIQVPEVIRQLATDGTMTQEKATEALDNVNYRVQNLVDGLAASAAKAEKASIAAQDTFAAPLAVPPELVGTEQEKLMTSYQRAVDGLAQLKASGIDRALTADELKRLGFDDNMAMALEEFGYGYEGSMKKQEVKLHSGRQLLNSLFLPTVPGNADRTSGAILGDFSFSDQGLARAWNSWTGSLSDKLPRTIQFGPQKGQVLSGSLAHELKPGSVNVVETSPLGQTVDPKIVKRMYAITRQWIDKYAPGMAVVLNVHSDASGNTLGHQLYSYDGAGQGTTVHEIDILVEPNAGESELIMTLSHEFGHAMFIRQYAIATLQMREALRQMWVKETFIDNWNNTRAELMAVRRPYEYMAHGKTMRELVRYQLMSKNIHPKEENQKALDYWTNFLEWHAHRMERMLVSDYQGMTAPVKKFWRTAYAKLKNFFTQEHAKWQPDQTFAEWMRLMRQHEAAMQKLRMAETTMHATFDTGLWMTPNTGKFSVNGQPTPAENLGAISPANSPQVPPTPPASEAAPTYTGSVHDDFVTSVKRLGKVLRKTSPEHGQGVLDSAVKFNEMWAKLLGSFQVLELNKNVPGATRFLNALRSKFGYKSQWLRGANILANKWEGLGKEQAGAVAKLLLTESESDTWFSTITPDPDNPGHRIFMISPEKMAEFGITPAGAEVYSQVRDSFMRALDAMEQLGVERIERTFETTDPQRQKQLDELHASYENMRAKPYTPFSRFGKYYVRIKAKDNGIFKDPITGTSKMYTAGQTVYFETFETPADRDNALPDLQKRYGNSPMLDAQFNTGKIHDIVYSARNLPPEFARAIAERLDLTQEQLQEYNDLLKDLASDSSFIKHMKRKANISGYSPDALRGFADYFMRFSNNYAKGKSAPEFESAMRDVRDYKRQIEETETDTTKLDEFYNWMQRTFNYVMNPGNEMAELKSFVTAWYLGFNVPTAVQNVTQLAFWTFPYLSKRFGVAKSLGAMKTALGDVLGSWKTMDRLSADEKAVMTYALEQGFIDESFATSIAQFAEGTALSRLTATATRHRALNWYNHKALYMFQLMEEINRRTSLLATYRLNKKADFTGEFDHAAFMKAREAVEVTQNEYALENRPEFMRGNKSVIFQFMHYVQNAIFRMTPWGDDSWKRLLLMQLAVAGLLGMPFAEDLMNAGKFLARKFGVHFEPELMMRQLLLELGVAPDLVLRGAASHLGPFDASYRYSLGQVIPGMSAIGSNKRFNDAMLEAVGDVGGAGATIGVNALKAIASLEDPRKLKTAQYVMPSFVKYGLQAMDASNEGGVIARNGALIAPLEGGEILGMGFGLQPRTKSEAYKKIGFESEMRNYWQARRAIVLDNMYEAKRTKDREAMADVRQRVREFNKEARKIEPKLVITAEVAQRSFRNRRRLARMQELTGSPYKNPTMTRTISEAVPEWNEE